MQAHRTTLANYRTTAVATFLIVLCTVAVQLGVSTTVIVLVLILAQSTTTAAKRKPPAAS